MRKTAHRCVAFHPLYNLNNQFLCFSPRLLSTLDKNNSVKRVKEPAELAAAASDAFAVTPAASSTGRFVDGCCQVFSPQRNAGKLLFGQMSGCLRFKESFLEDVG